jgi:SAM-dependent methyltransferase
MTLGPDYFEAMYKTAADPWGFDTRWYEARKYAISLAMLPRAHYERAFEPGCSIGVLTEMLGSRCDSVVACDLSAAAVEAARCRTEHQPGVRVGQARIPADWPAGTFDLVVLSEVLYYFGPEDLDLVLHRVLDALDEGSTLLAVHWRHPVRDYPLGGDQVHRALAALPGLTLLADHLEPDFVAQVYQRARPGTPPGEISVAAAEGLL